MSIIALGFAIVFFAVGLATVYKGKVAATVTFAVSVLVAFVPEGLPSVVTLLLSIAAKRMAAQNVLVKDLQGVETLGSVNTFAFMCFSGLTPHKAHTSCDRQDWNLDKESDDGICAVFDMIRCGLTIICR